MYSQLDEVSDRELIEHVFKRGSHVLHTLQRYREVDLVLSLRTPIGDLVSDELPQLEDIAASLFKLLLVLLALRGHLDLLLHKLYEEAMHDLLRANVVVLNLQDTIDALSRDVHLGLLYQERHLERKLRVMVGLHVELYLRDEAQGGKCRKLRAITCKELLFFN